MIELKYSLVIEATEASLEYAIPPTTVSNKARWGMEEHVALLRERGLPVPGPNE
jgi:hypothetical protein